MSALSSSGLYEKLVPLVAYNPEPRNIVSSSPFDSAVVSAWRSSAELVTLNTAARAP
ncbi:MAG: hypothetical protein IH795_11910 [Bacteroidetes bacterium]|nr:hypothetical protein [Bacteroidota bacterium]